MSKLYSKLGLLSFLFLLSANSFSEDHVKTKLLTRGEVSSEKPLPNWIDPTREKNDYLEPTWDAPQIGPENIIRIPAEYEPAKAVVLGWRGYSNILEQIAVLASTFGNAEVWSVSGPSKINGVPSEKVIRIDCPLNTVWMRDYGPFGIQDDLKSVGIVDTIYRHYGYRRDDDKAPTCIADKKTVPVYSMGIILDGGNLMVDSAGNLFMTERTYGWNSNLSREKVDEVLKNSLKIKKIHTFEYPGFPGQPADGTGHIDMYVKLLNDSTVLITQTESEPFKTACEKAVKYFTSVKAPNGSDYKIIRVPGWQSHGTWYTYTNSLIVNKSVIIPAYRNHDKENQVAIEKYQYGLPEYKISPIFSDDSISSGGSIHCVTQLVPTVK